MGCILAMMAAHATWVLGVRVLVRNSADLRVPCATVTGLHVCAFGVGALLATLFLEAGLAWLAITNFNLQLLLLAFVFWYREDL